MMANYSISEAGKAITCHHCGRTSHNPHDVQHLYCGHCHAFIGDDPVKQAWLKAALALVEGCEKAMGDPWHQH